jgi:hypothetical protein
VAGARSHVRLRGNAVPGRKRRSRCGASASSSCNGRGKRVVRVKSYLVAVHVTFAMCGTPAVAVVTAESRLVASQRGPGSHNLVSGLHASLHIDIETPPALETRYSLHLSPLRLLAPAACRARPRSSPSDASPHTTTIAATSSTTAHRRDTTTTWPTQHSRGSRTCQRNGYRRARRRRVMLAAVL